MKKQFFFAALALVALASCTSDDFVGENNNSPNPENGNTNAIMFTSGVNATTRSGEFIGATAAEKLGKMFVVEGTKGTEQTNSPSTTVVFDNYLVGYEYNSAGKTEDNTNNWEYVGLQTGIPGKLSGTTWTALHGEGKAQEQSIKYWDYSQAQYDFIAWSTGACEAITGDAENGKVKVTRIATGTNLSSTTAPGAFTFTAARAADLLECYYTDITTVKKDGTGTGNYGEPVTLTFKNMAAKVRVALYETVPGYSVKDVKFYSEDPNPTAPTDLGTGSSATNAVLFTMGTGNVLPQSGTVLVYYPHIGTTHRDASGGQTKDYNKASVIVTPGDGTGATSTTQTFGALAKYVGKEKHETASTVYLGRSLPEATFAGDITKDYYTAVIPNTNGKPLTLRVDYTLVSTDGSNEEIHVYGAKAVVPATYTVWQPNYAYTYVFKISDNSNGWTSQTNTDPKGLFPITFDAVVANFTDANAEQTTITTVATPSITTYQQGHKQSVATNDEYSKSQKAGVSNEVKDVYVQVMDNSVSPSILKDDLHASGKSRLYKITKSGSDYEASEAEVMDALKNRAASYNYVHTTADGRNGVHFEIKAVVSNTVTSIINGVDDQPITKIAGANIVAGQVAKIDIDQLDKGIYAYVYATTVPNADEKIYNVVSATDAGADPTKYYEVALTGTETPLASGTAAAGKVYFVKNVDAEGTFVSYTFKQTKVGDDVTGLVEAVIPGSKASTYTAGHFYFDVYNRNNGEYAVKVIKVVD